MLTAQDARDQLATIVAEFRAGCGPEGALATLRNEIDDAAYAEGEEIPEDGPLATLLAEFVEADIATATDAEWAEALAVALNL